MIRYVYAHSVTEGTTGYFSCMPEPMPTMENALRALVQTPLDDFLRRHILSRMTALDGEKAAAILQATFPGLREGALPLPIAALIRELALLNPAFAPAYDLYAKIAQHDDSDSGTSLVFLRWRGLPDHEVHRHWTKVFAANRVEHRALKRTDDLPPLDYTDDGRPGTSAAFTAPFTVGLADIHAAYAGRYCDAPPFLRPPAAETAALAEERLSALGIIGGQEMRHTASLSPVALLRPWNMRLHIRRGRHNLTLEGPATTYGRGLTVADARASCLMEMAERASAYLSIDGDGIPGLASPVALKEGTRSELLAQGLRALNPNDYPLEVPYRDEPLLWMPGVSSADATPVLIPVQMVSLFCNLDEMALFDSPGSTGIATGRIREEAKIAALLEIAERDAESTTPFSKAGCFTLEADDDPFLAALLADYKARGIHVQFQDIAGSLGIPVYKCFVMSRKGHISAGHGAGLSARRAVISALTETPFPYPDGGPSGPLLRNLPVRTTSGLPDYSLPTPAANLAMLEDLFIKNGRAPVYADLTREDIGFPVVRVFVPGLELASDSDFSRVPYRLYSSALSFFTS